MAHIVIIQSVFTDQNDRAIITGTVDGIPTTAQCWHSALNQFPNVTTGQTFIANLLIQQAFPPQPISNSTWNGIINI